MALNGDIIGPLKLSYNTPFYTGFILDTSTLVALGYDTIQLKLLNYLAQLKEHQSNNWFDEEGDTFATVEEDPNREIIEDDGLVFSPAKGYAGKSIISRSILLKFIGQHEIEDHTIDENGEWILTFNGIKYIPTKAEIYFHDNGVGLCSVEGNVDLANPISIIEYKEFVEGVSSSLSKVFNPFIVEYSEYFFKILENVGLNPESIDRYHDKIKGQFKNMLLPKKALWWHRVYMVQMLDKYSDEAVRRYSPLINSTVEDFPPNTARNPNIYEAPGNGCSLILHAEDASVEYLSNMPRIIEIAQYVYAAVSLWDHILFLELAEFMSEEFALIRSVKEAERQLYSLQQIEAELDFFLMGLDNMLVTFSPQSMVYWLRLLKEWKLDIYIDTLKEKLKLVHEKFETHLEKLNEARSASISRFIKIFTVISLIVPAMEGYRIVDDFVMNATGNALWDIILDLNPIFYVLGIFGVGLIGFLIYYFVFRVK